MSGSVELDNTLEGEDTLNNIENAIKDYLSQINFQKTELSYARLLNVALSSDGVNDITDFKLNGGYTNITCDEMEVFALSSFEMEVE